MCGLIFGILSIVLLITLVILLSSKDDIQFMELWFNEAISKHRK